MIMTTTTTTTKIKMMMMMIMMMMMMIMSYDNYDDDSLQESIPFKKLYCFLPTLHNPIKHWLRP